MFSSVCASHTNLKRNTQVAASIERYYYTITHDYRLESERYGTSLNCLFSYSRSRATSAGANHTCITSAYLFESDRYRPGLSCLFSHP
jgi:hypothetical protein